MKSVSEFNQFYQERIKIKTDELEAARSAITVRYSYRKYARSLVWLFSFAIALIILSNIFSEIPKWVISIVPAIILYSIVTPIYILLKRTRAFSPIKAEYERTVVKNIITFVHPDFKHSPDKGISLNDFNMSGMFDKADAYKSNDLITGEIEGRQIQISSVFASRKTKIREGSRSTTVTIFTGLFSVVMLPKPVKGKTFVYSSVLANKAIVSPIQSLIGENAMDFINERLKPATIKTGDVEFDKYFYLRFEGEPPQTYVNPRLIETLTLLRREMEIPIHISLIEDKAYFGFEGIELFPLSAHASIVKEDLAKKYFQYLNRAVGLSEALTAIVESD